MSNFFMTLRAKNLLKSVNVSPSYSKNNTSTVLFLRHSIFSGGFLNSKCFSYPYCYFAHCFLVFFLLVMTC